jgi:lipoprotein-anchoring transpeptidase ErfK/SrfK
MSTNYHDAIARSLAKIDASDKEIRLRFYDRARALLADRLTSSDPALAPAMVAAELAAFDTAIAKVESEYLRRTVSVDARPVFAPRSGQGAPADVSDERRPRGSKAGLHVVIGAVGAAIVVLIGGLTWWRMQDSAPAPTTQRPAPIAVPAPAVAAVDRDRGRSDAAQAEVEKLPYFMRRQVVYYRSTHPAGTIVITKSQHFLYVVKSDSAALRYTIALGSDCADSGGLYSIARKDGVDPPAPSATDRALYLDKAGYRIRATDVLAAIGQNSPAQGFQLLRDDIVDLDERAPIGTRVVVMN